MADPDPNEDSPKKLAEDIEFLRQAVIQLQKRLRTLEARERPHVVPAPIQPPDPPVVNHPEPIAIPDIDWMVRPPVKPPSRPAPPRVVEPVAVAPSLSLEERIGGKWFNWVGILAILFGVGYFLKYSFDQGWVSPAMRFAGGIVLGVGMLAAGQWAKRRDYGFLARGLWGGGIGVLYLIFFSGFRLLNNPATGQPLITQQMAFAGMIVTTAAAAAISIRANTRTVITMASVGGYLTPVLLSTGESHQVPLSVYLAILTAGFLSIGYWRRWGFLPWVSFVAVVLFSPGWIFSGENRQVAALSFMALFFVMFSLEPVFWTRLKGHTTDRASRTRVAINSLLFVVGGLFVLENFLPSGQGFFLLAASVYHFFVAVYVFSRRNEEAAFANLLGSAAAILFLSVPLFEHRIHEEGRAVAWVLQGMLIFVAGFRWSGFPLRIWGLLGLAMGIVRLLAFDTPEGLVHVSPYALLLNARAAVFPGVIVVFAGASWLYARAEKGTLAEWFRRAKPAEPEKFLSTLVLIAAVSLPATYLSLEFADAFRHYANVSIRVQPALLEHYQGIWLSLIWSAYATLVIAIARRRDQKVLMGLGSLFLVVTFVKMASVDLGLNAIYEVHPVLNVRCLTLALQSAFLFWLAFDFKRPELKGTFIEGSTALFAVAGHVGVNALLGLEIFDWFHAHPEWHFPYGAWRAILGVWAIYAIPLLFRGIRDNAPSRRMLALGMMIVALLGTVACNFRSDVSERDLLLNVRFLAGWAVATALFCGMLMYRKWGGKLEVAATLGGEEEARVLPVVMSLAGHALMLMILTMEAGDYFTGRELGVQAWIQQGYARQMTYSIIWTVYAIGMVLAGFIRKFKPVRLMALAILAVSIIKVFLHDLGFLQGVYRVLSFMALGAILVGVSYLYQRFKAQLVG